MPEILKYFFLINPSLSAGLFNFGAAMWLVCIGLKTHILLTKSYYAMPPEIQHRRASFRPICVQAVRTAILYAFVYCIGEIHWIFGQKWEKIGEPADLVWSAIEFLGFYAILLWLRLGRMVANQNQERRQETGND